MGRGKPRRAAPAKVMYRGKIGNLVQSVTGRGRPSISKTLKESTQPSKLIRSLSKVYLINMLSIIVITQVNNKKFLRITNLSRDDYYIIIIICSMM